MVKIICGCQKLVEVVDRFVVDHEDAGGELCRGSGMRYVSKKFGSGLPSSPSFEIVAAREGKCQDCGVPMVEALIRSSGPDPSMN